MAPSTSAQLLLSPAELSYLHSSLSLDPPLRPDSRSPTQFRPLIAETDILPGTNGSARICFADGTEAIVGVKAEVEKSREDTTVPASIFGTRKAEDKEAEEDPTNGSRPVGTVGPTQDEPMGDAQEASGGSEEEITGPGKGENSWVELTIEIPGYRDDDALPVFLAAMLNEALLASGELTDKLWLNRRFHWRLYIDILLLSPPLSYPLPLLSLTTHLALLSTRLPALKSESDEDPLFNDDWEASLHLYPQSPPINPANDPKSSTPSLSLSFHSRPPITLLVMAMGQNIIFDPSREELAVADAVLAVSVGYHHNHNHDPSRILIPSSTKSEPRRDQAELRLLSIRTIDPPSRLTQPGLPDSVNSATGGGGGGGGGGGTGGGRDGKGKDDNVDNDDGVWRPPVGGMKRGLVGRVVGMVLGKGGVGEEVMAGLGGVDIG